MIRGSDMDDYTRLRKLVDQLRKEYFDMNCKGVTEYAPITAKLNGVPAVVRTDNSAVVAGEVGIDLEGLYLYFNPVDFGKTIELECTRYWNK